MLRGRFADVVDLAFGEVAVDRERREVLAGLFGVGVGAGLETETVAVRR